MSSRGGSGRRCEAHRADGERCRAWAVRSSDPPRCASHSGLAGAPPDNKNAETHGFYSRPALPIEGIDDVILELQARMTRLCEHMDKADELEDYERLFALFAQSTNRLGRLLRDQKALSGKAIDDVLENLAIAAENLSTVMGWNVFDE
jgi:hypothetical protein